MLLDNASAKCIPKDNGMQNGSRGEGRALDTKTGVQSLEQNERAFDLWEALRFLGEFTAHVLIATVLFCIVSLAAVGLNFFVHWLEILGLPQYITVAGPFLEYFVFTVDVAVFISYVLREAWRMIKRIFRG